MAADGIRVTGRFNAERTLAVIGHNLRHAELSAPKIFRYLEGKYRIAFDDWFPAMWETGATDEAWTNEGAWQAIRRRHAGIEFGSGIDYNRFHQKRLLGVIDQQVEDHMAEIMADTFVPPERIGGPGVITGYYATRLTKSGPREVYVRPHVRGQT